MIGTVLSAAATIFFVAMAAISSGWSVFWFLLLAVGGAAETIAMYRKKQGDTFSAAVWIKTRALWQQILLAAFLVWLLVHLTFQNIFD